MKLIYLSSVIRHFSFFILHASYILRRISFDILPETDIASPPIYNKIVKINLSPPTACAVNITTAFCFSFISSGSELIRIYMSRKMRKPAARQNRLRHCQAKAILPQFFTIFIFCADFKEIVTFQKILFTVRGVESSGSSPPRE